MGRKRNRRKKQLGVSKDSSRDLESRGGLELALDDNDLEEPLLPKANDHKEEEKEDKEEKEEDGVTLECLENDKDDGDEGEKDTCGCRDSDVEEGLVETKHDDDGSSTSGGHNGLDNDNELTDRNIGDRDASSDSETSHRGTCHTVCGDSYSRKAAIVLAVVDLTVTLSIYRFTIYQRYPLYYKALDVLLLTLLRSHFVFIQAAWMDSVYSAKAASYFALLSFLYMSIKASTSIQWHANATHTQTDSANDTSLSSPYAILIIITTINALFQSITEWLILMFSCKPTQHDIDAATTTGVTAASEGISIDQTKTINLGELLQVLRPYFWPDGIYNRISAAFTWIFLILSKLANIAAPLFIAKATDDLASSQNTRNATIHIIAYALLLFANKAFKEAQALSYIRVKLIAAVQLQTNVFTHLLTLSMDWHQRKSTGAVITAMQRGINASNTVVQYLFLYLFPTFVECIVVCFVFVTSFKAPLLAACAVCGVVTYTVVTLELTIWRMKFRKRMNKADNDANHKATDSLLNFETVKYFTAETHEVERYKESVDISQNQAYKIQGSLSMLNVAQQLILNGTLVAALLVAAYEFRHGEFTIGQFVAVNVYVIQLFSPLNFLGSIYGYAVGAYVDLQNLCNLLAEKPDVEDRDDAKVLCPPPSLLTTTTAAGGEDTVLGTGSSTKRPLKLQFRNVSFAYPSRKDVPILKNVSFVVPAGTTTAIVGETGSGKSTITRLLFRFYEADRGRVLVGNQDVMDLTQTSLRENLGAVPQDHALFNDTFEYNVRYGSSVLRRINGANDSEYDPVGTTAVVNAIDAAALTDFLDTLPDGLQTKVGERGQQVSGGQKQRIAIARVLLKDAPVLILDEATSSLDSGTEELIQSALFGNTMGGSVGDDDGGGDGDGDGTGDWGRNNSSTNLRGRKTILVIAHRLSTVQDADQILVMAKGEILERGTHEELIAKGLWHERCYASLWDKQKKTE